ncbi:MAG: hypothetical protein F6K28_44405, partial [Microcoleus sp. SIO2G3]|nr:hypothetical protein [Microcoleus sp. SIO2G3]
MSWSHRTDHGVFKRNECCKRSSTVAALAIDMHFGICSNLLKFNELLEAAKIAVAIKLRSAENAAQINK